MCLIFVVVSDQRISIVVNGKIVDMKELFHISKKRFCVATGSSEKCWMISMNFFGQGYSIGDVMCL